MAKIVILEGFNSNPGDQSWDEIEALGDVTIHDRTQQNEILAKVKDADIIITNKLKITREVMDGLPNLKLIHQLATGTDNIDKRAAEEKGILVKNAVGYSTNAVAQHTFALILELTSHVAIHSTESKAGGWTQSGDWCHMLKTPIELNGKTLGIIGFGKIGKAVAQLGLAFGMKVILASKHAKPNQYTDVEVVSIDDLAGRSDFVSIHSPLTDENTGIINQSFLNRMRPSAFLINTARGGHVIERDLYDALKNKRIAGAGLDVLLDEPPRPDNPLLKLDNCLITSHIAWTAYESRKRLITIVASNISEFLKTI